MGINRPKDWPENRYDKRIQSEREKGESFMAGVLRTMGADLGAMRLGFKATVDERDKQILKYLKDKGVLDLLNKE